MFKNLNYHQLTVLLKIAFHCPYLEMRYLIPLAKEVAKHCQHTAFRDEDVAVWLKSNKPNLTSGSWYDIVTKADYDVVRSYINEAFND